MKTNLKNRTKKILKTFFFFFFTGIIFCSCTKDDGFNDDNSTVDLFVGSWRVSDNELKINYDIIIEEDNNNYSGVLIHGFAGSQGAAKALIVGRTITIETQSVGNSWYVSGEGALKTNNVIEISYKLVISGSSELRKAIFTRL